jgi:hypothetical protein
LRFQTGFLTGANSTCVSFYPQHNFYPQHHDPRRNPCPYCQQHRAIEFATSPARAFILLAQLQLALRHPDNTGPQRRRRPRDSEQPGRDLLPLCSRGAGTDRAGLEPRYDVTRKYYKEEFWQQDERDATRTTTNFGAIAAIACSTIRSPTAVESIGCLQREGLLNG